MCVYFRFIEATHIKNAHVLIINASEIFIFISISFIVIYIDLYEAAVQARRATKK